MNQKHERFRQLKSLGQLMDSKFEGPWGLRFGLDGLLGFLPVGGDLLTSGISFYIIYQAALLGCAPATIARMALNVLWENLFDLVPVLGNFYDLYFKANNKNIALLEAHLQNPRGVDKQSKFIVFGILVALVCLLAVSGYVTFIVLRWVFEYVGNLF
jgi:hypothetical protein